MFDYRKNGDVSEECRIIFVDEIFKIEKAGMQKIPSKFGINTGLDREMV